MCDEIFRDENLFWPWSEDTGLGKGLWKIIRIGPAILSPDNSHWWLCQKRGRNLNTQVACSFAHHVKLCVQSLGLLPAGWPSRYVALNPGPPETRTKIKHLSLPNTHPKVTMSITENRVIQEERSGKPGPSSHHTSYTPPLMDVSRPPFQTLWHPNSL